MKAFSARLAEKSFLLAAVGDMLAVLCDVTDWVQSEFSVLGRDVPGLIFARPVSDFLLGLSLDERCFVLTQLLLPDVWRARRYFRGVQHCTWTRGGVWWLDV